MKRDNIHYNVQEDDGFNTPIVFIVSPREPGKTTSILLDKIYSGFKKYRIPAIVCVNMAADITEAYLASFEETINKFDGYHIETKYSKSSKDTAVIVRARLSEDETFDPFIYIVPFSAPLTRLKRMNPGRVSCMWYDECNVNVAIGEKWPSDICIKWNELYTTLARNNYPQALKFYATGNYYTRYNPLMVYLGIDCSKLTMGAKIVTHRTKKVGDIEVDYSSLVNCYALKPELVEYILKHNPGYAFDDTYQKYFLGQAIGDEGVPIQESQPEGYVIKTVFRIASRYLYIWKSNKPEDKYNWKYWLESTDRTPGKRRDIFVCDVSQLQTGTILAKAYKTTFDNIRRAIGDFNVAFNSNEAYYLMQQIYAAT